MLRSRSWLLPIFALSITAACGGDDDAPAGASSSGEPSPSGSSSSSSGASSGATSSSSSGAASSSSGAASSSSSGELVDSGSDAALDAAAPDAGPPAACVGELGLPGAPVQRTGIGWSHEWAQPIVAADFDGDGMDDVAYATDPADVAVHLSRGAGRFEASVSTALPADVRALAPANFDDDGRPDLIASTTLGVVALLGAGDGTFVAVPGPPETGTIAAGDFTNDGRTDIVVTTAQSIVLYTGHVDGTFTKAAPLTLSTPSNGHVLVGHFDAHVALDLAYSSADGSSVFTVHGTGDATFGTIVQTPVNDCPAIVAALDLDGDGDLDLVCAGAVDFTVLDGLGNGSFTEHSTSFPKGQTTVADFDGDGAFELASVTSDRFAATVYGHDAGGLAARGAYASYGLPIGTTAGDFDGDGKADLAITTDGALGTMLDRGDGTLGAPLDMPGVARDSVATGDFDEDGRLDYVTSGGDGVDVTLTRGDRVQSTTSLTTLDDAREVVTSDIDGDGHLDLLVAEIGHGLWSWRGNGDGTFAADPVLAVTAPAIAWVAAGHFDGDAFVDVALGQVNASAAMFRGTGSGAFQPVQGFTATNVRVRAGDFDEDGRDEMVHVINGTVRVLHTDAATGFQNGLLDLDTGSSATDVALADVDGDGHLDVAASHATDGTVSVIYGNGDGTFLPSQTVAVLGAARLTVADLTRDGRPDLVVTGTGVSVLPGSGNRAFGLALSYATGTTAATVRAGDFDADGRLDLVVTRTASGPVTLWQDGCLP